MRTNDIGTVNIEWDNVAKVEAARYFEVVTTNGSRYLGSLGPATAGAMAVVTPAGPVTLPLGDVISIAPIGASFWTKLDGSINAEQQKLIDATERYFSSKQQPAGKWA